MSVPPQKDIDPDLKCREIANTLFRDIARLTKGKPVECIRKLCRSNRGDGFRYIGEGYDEATYRLAWIFVVEGID
uniref:Uncharacterized protein n=1 Tax=Candidatus Kentrum sp. FW TaxID=2126338 RepID=A0A450TUW6_9GAMM|nr:MAG: hypothetical protein BECKFW1821C_GA0114237_103719 [Candidatus Kentron sp. FW]